MFNYIKSFMVSIALFLREIKTANKFKQYKSTLQNKVVLKSPDYEAYLDTQLRRTVSKENAPLQTRTRILVDKLATLTDLSQHKVLCIGCRNIQEINYFQEKGAKSVLGIDLYSTHPDIQVMDMHNMTFPDDRFSVVYTSHSLEHAYDIEQVISEIIRVAQPKAYLVIEIPIQFETRGSDLVDVGKLQNLHALFNPYIEQVLWSEELFIEDSNEVSGNSIVRTIFTVLKETD